MTLLAETRKQGGKTQYLCAIIDGWVNGRKWNGSGFTQIVCEHCGAILDSDPFGHWEAESQKGKKDQNEQTT